MRPCDSSRCSHVADHLAALDRVAGHHENATEVNVAGDEPGPATGEPSRTALVETRPPRATALSDPNGTPPSAWKPSASRSKCSAWPASVPCTSTTLSERTARITSEPSSGARGLQVIPGGGPRPSRNAASASAER